MAENMTNWAHFIHPQIAGCPVPALIDSVRDAAIQFCNETYLWTYTFPRINVVADQNDYTLTDPGGELGEIIVIDDAKYKQEGFDDDQFKRLDPMSENQADLDPDRFPGSWQFTTGTVPDAYYLKDEDPNTLYLWRIPTEASTGGLLVRVNLRPTRTAVTLPDFMWNKYAQHISEGALADLFTMKNMPWYDPLEAERRGVAWSAAKSDAKFFKYSGATKRPLRVRMRRGIGL